MTTQLATVPLRAVLYLRQSIAREESISLELQETAGREHCARQGYAVVAVEADPGISGRTWKRPAVQRVMTMIEQRDADVVVLWKWSRLSRSRLDWAVAADRVETAGGRIESATEPLDTSTSAGRLARGMMTEFAAFESERIGDVWRETHARRLSRGLPATGKPRYGYAYSRDEGFTPDPVTGPVLAELYRRYINGESVYSLTAWLNDGPTRPSGGYGPGAGAWSDRTIRRVLDSGFGAGLLHVGDDYLPGAHPALISPDEWDAYRVARVRRRGTSSSDRSVHLLSGIIRCACGSPMHAGLYGANHSPKYRCRAAHAQRAHPGGYVTASYVEQAVFDWLRRYERELLAEAEAVARRPRKLHNVVSDADRIERRIADVDRRLDELTMRLLDGTVPQASFVRVRDQLQDERRRLDLARATAAGRAAPPPVVMITGALDRWSELRVEEQRELVRALVDRVIVSPGRPRAGIEIIPRE